MTNDINKQKRTAEQEELLEYLKKARPCRRCNRPVEPDPDFINLPGLLQLLECSESLSEAKRAIDTTPVYCAECWQQNITRAQEKWGRSPDLVAGEGYEMDLSQDEVVTVCVALQSALSAEMDELNEGEGVEVYWLVYQIDTPTGGTLVIHMPKFNTGPDCPHRLDEEMLKLYWRMQNFLIAACGEEPISASEYFPTKELQRWGLWYEREVGFEVIGRERDPLSGPAQMPWVD